MRKKGRSRKREGGFDASQIRHIDGEDLDAFDADNLVKSKFETNHTDAPKSQDKDEHPYFQKDKRRKPRTSKLPEPTLDDVKRLHQLVNSKVSQDPNWINLKVDLKRRGWLGHFRHRLEVVKKTLTFEPNSPALPAQIKSLMEPLEERRGAIFTQEGAGFDELQRLFEASNDSNTPKLRL